MIAALLSGLCSTSLLAGWSQSFSSSNFGYWNISVPSGCSVSGSAMVSDGTSSGAVHIDVGGIGTLVEIWESGYGSSYQSASGPAGTYTVYLRLNGSGYVQADLSW